MNRKSLIYKRNTGITCTKIKSLILKAKKNGTPSSGFAWSTIAPTPDPSLWAKNDNFIAFLILITKRQVPFEKFFFLLFFLLKDENAWNDLGKAFCIQIRTSSPIITSRKDLHSGFTEKTATTFDVTFYEKLIFYSERKKK